MCITCNTSTNSRGFCVRYNRGHYQWPYSYQFRPNWQLTTLGGNHLRASITHFVTHFDNILQIKIFSFSSCTLNSFLHNGDSTEKIKRLTTI